MLVLTRKVGEELCIGDDIRIVVLSQQGNKIRFGVTAPQEVSVHRREIYDKILEDKKNKEKDHE